jgi:hypothetical protein
VGRRFGAGVAGVAEMSGCEIAGLMPVVLMAQVAARAPKGETAATAQAVRVARVD